MGADQEVSMFVQVIEARTSDPEGVRKQLDKWMADLRPGAKGYIGTTSGVAADGRTVAFVRFESEDAARANSDRPEQGAWWAEMEKLLDGVRFSESSDVTTFLAGGSDDAGFVQVMKVAGVDRSKVDEGDRQFEQVAAELRPDLIGGLRVWTAPGEMIEANYFTSEADARKGEQTPPPAEMAASFGEFMEMMKGAEFIDLSDPFLHSA
jgi:hypothetical protein